MKKLLITVSLIVFTGAFYSGCTREKTADDVTAASIVDNPAAFIKAAGEEGSWIIAVTQDVAVNEEIVLAGEFENRGEPARKIALYTQDEERRVSERFSLKAPRLTVRSMNARIQGGTFVGDIYVEANNFMIVDAVVDGDIYFKNEEYRSTFQLEDDGEVTGRLVVQ